MEESAEDLVRRLHEREIERVRREGAGVHRPPDSSSVPWGDIPPAPPGGQLAAEWSTFRRELGRLLAEGRQGWFVLIKGELVAGLYLTEQEALAVGYRTFPGQAFLVHQIRAHEPLVRCVSVRSCAG